jgi:hypothetical protein
MAQVRREVIEEDAGPAVVVDRGRGFNPIAWLIALALLAVFAGPIHETFNNDGKGANVHVDKPNVSVNNKG